MLKKVQSYLTFGTIFCGIEHTTEKGQDKLCATLLKKKKKEVDIKDSFSANTLKELTEKLPKNQHAVLIINNDSVITKKIESSQTDMVKLVHNAFPNINLEDFYYQVLIQKSIHFVSICRKNYIETLTTQYKAQHISIIDISLGNHLTGNVSSFIQSKVISTSNASLSLENNSITDIKRTINIEPTKYDINGIKISNIQLLSFSGALTTILNIHLSNSNFETQKQLLINDFKHTRFFKQFLKVGIIFIFGLLLINFFIFNYYYNNVNMLKQSSQISQATKSRVLKLNKKVSNTKKTVDDILQSRSSKSSFYTNAITNSIPHTILLSDINYQPVLKRIKANQAIQNDTNTILISGTSNNSTSFSNWIASLESINWINKVEILNYEDMSLSKSNFNIKLNMTNESQN